MPLHHRSVEPRREQIGPYTADAAYIREARRRCGLTTESFAKAIGVHASTVYRWESGLHPISDDARGEIELLLEPPPRIDHRSRDFRMLPPRPDTLYPQKLAAVRRKILTGHFRMVPAARRDEKQLRERRLKQPWLTVTPYGNKGDISFYLNTAARVLFFKGDRQFATVYGTLDPDTQTLRILRTQGGQPLLISRDAKTFNRTLSRAMADHGYTGGTVSVYFPIVPCHRGIVADLSRAYTKRAAQQKEEDDATCGERRARRSRPGS